MEIQVFNDFEVGKHLDVMKSVGITAKQEQALNEISETEEKETEGFGLGLGSRGLSGDGNGPVGVSQETERGHFVAWQISAGGTVASCPAELRVRQLESNMAVIMESDVLHQKGKEVDCDEQREVGTILHDSEQTELWRMDSIERLHSMDESRVPEQAGMEEEKWEPEHASLKVQDWYKHGCEDRHIEEQKEALIGPRFFDSGWHVIYQECQRNITAVKGTTVHDGCGEFMAGVGDVMSDALNCAACGCHRNFHRRVVLGRDGMDLEFKEREASETREALISIRKVAGAIKAGAGRALSLISLDQGKAKVKGLTSSEQSFVIKSCVEALGQTAKAMFATAECLAFLQKTNVAPHACPQETCRLEQGLPTVTPHDDTNIVASREPKPGSPPPLFCSEQSPSTPFSPSKLGWQDGTFCFTDKALSETSLNERKRKRKRIRFTFEQLKKLNEFATRTGWTLAGVCKEEVDALCADIGIEAVTLKYWIHNTRQKSRKKVDNDTKTYPGTL